MLILNAIIPSVNLKFSDLGMIFVTSFFYFDIVPGKRTPAQELRHKSITLAHYFVMGPKLTFQSNLVPKLTFCAEVTCAKHRLPPLFHHLVPESLSDFVRVSGRLYNWLIIFQRNHADHCFIWSLTVWSSTNGLTNFPLNNFVKTLAESICHFYETNMDTLFMRLSGLISKELSSWHHSILSLPGQYFHSHHMVEMLRDDSVG